MSIRQAEFQKMIAALTKEQQREIRGITLEPRSTWGGKPTEGVTFTEVNFNAPLFGGLLTRPVFQRCSFNNCDLDGINAKKTEFIDCTFERTALGRNLAGSLSACVFRGCTFRKCSMVSIFFIECRFENCEFDHNTIEKVNFQRCQFSGSRYWGKLHTVNFTTCQMRGCDFTEAELADCAFDIDDWSGVRMPDRPDNFVVNPDAFVKAKRAVQGKLTELGYERFAALADYVAGTDLKREIVHRELFEELPDQDSEIVQRTLYQISKSSS